MPDDQRPLLEKGKKRTRKIIEYLMKNNVMPDVIISSHAVRALETAKIVAHGIKFPVNDIIISHNLYHCQADGIFSETFAFDDDIAEIMLVGHNPTLTNFINKFFDPPVDYLPTSGLAAIAFDTDQWVDLPLAQPKPVFIVFPKEL